VSLIKLFSRFTHQAPPAKQEAENAMAEIGFSLPADLRELYVQSNGGEGECGKTYLSFWPATDIRRLNEAYQIQKYLGEKVLGIGSDGGGDCLVLAYGSNQEEPGLYFVAFGDLDRDSMRIVGNTFSEAIANCHNGKYTHPE
jgi:SMI1 / KNR4 family (SUKH-1)